MRSRVTHAESAERAAPIAADHAFLTRDVSLVHQPVSHLGAPGVSTRRNAMDAVTDDPLLDAIRAVPMRCANCGETTGTRKQCPEESGSHSWETDDAAIARAVRVFVRERVTREAT